ncbi:glycosyltransferase family A protein [Bifidobacterium sp. ESL0784]|uniref:glycosyltransferase family 2 protein n=1 Tax=Bifidobacterium sp. ESL0784 TaxID=2983231 RepID=UPI0023F74DAC|nr:glycosyltransferase family A protein [Bifidobacterium sp. ESL0784]
MQTVTNDELVSVLIPAYNVESFVEKCLESVIQQTYSNIEIIVVNDGSTDGTLSVCNRMAQQDRRIRVYSQENAGLAETRNVLLSHVSGRYVTFIDSDDYVDKQYVELLLKWLVEADTDISVCGMNKVYPDGKAVKASKSGFEGKKLTLHDAIAALNSWRSFDASACAKLYKQELFSGISYPKGKITEDAYTTYKVLANADSVIYRNVPLYCYVYRAGSILHGGKINIDYAVAAQQQAEFFSSRLPSLNNICQSALAITKMAVYNELIEVDDDTALSRKEQEWLVDNKGTWSCLLRDSSLSWAKRLQALLFCISPRLYKIIVGPLLRKRTQRC